MGSRANIVVREGDRAVFLYAHWDGPRLASKLRNALASEPGKNRSDQPSYLTRIIFDRMTDDHEAETGYGIGCCPQDNQYPVLVVCPGERPRVELYDADKYDRLPSLFEGKAKFKPVRVWTFDEYTKDGHEEAFKLMAGLPTQAAAGGATPPGGAKDRRICKRWPVRRIDMQEQPYGRT